MNEQPDRHPEISVLIPCYNYGHFLADALNSVLGQTYSDWECLIIDDGSTDNSSEVAKRFQTQDSRFRYIFQKNAGLSAARNTGIRESKGHLLQFLDADDGLARNKLAAQMQYLKEHPEAGLVFGDALLFSGTMADAMSGKQVMASPGKAAKCSAAGSVLVQKLVQENMMEVSCPLVRRELIQAVGDFDTTYKSFEDWQYWFRAAIQGYHFHYLTQPGTETYIRKGHASMMQQLLQMNQAGLQLRAFMQRSLTGSLAWYNRKRVFRLLVKRFMLRIKSE
ncbi:MAG: glycosyltransferase family 2 protein [Bacteroidetes bacterium]|nr:glycosyltransferase family 2 protein [Bacteroidota bacterium]